jgi:hypothetical protein
MLSGRYRETDAILVRFEGETLSFEGAKALAPGTPVTVRTQREDGSELAIEGRAFGSRKPSADAPRFEIKARVVNLSKNDREWLQRTLAPRP